MDIELLMILYGQFDAYKKKNSTEGIEMATKVSIALLRIWML